MANAKYNNITARISAPEKHEYKYTADEVVFPGWKVVSGYEKQNPLFAVWLGIERTYYLTARILSFIGEIFIGKQSTDELGGILRIAQISGQVAELGIASYISFLAVLSINLGLINLFPIPLLDGGHLAFYMFEALRGRPLGPKAQEYGLRFGFFIVVALFVFVTWNDLVHLKFFEFVTGIFG